MMRSYHSRRNRLLISSATMAIATAVLFAQNAYAQAFQGRITSSPTTVMRTETSATSETITIASPTATINWAPTGQPNGNGNLDFLPAGNVATFQGTSNAGNYTVLNRVVPGGSNPIELNGDIFSYVNGGAPGGNIWFYSPNGILVGANAQFNVGGLLLSTADPGSNWSTSASGFTATMGPAAAGSFVTITNGAQINAQNSYVAMVAPRVTQAGTVNVNGSAAYVAADQLTMTFNQGLFDIAVDVGTDDPNGIVHSGTTTGAANAAASDSHAIYMVAVPKNNALTMLLQGGRVGFGDAVNASVQNGEIILSAGYSVGYDTTGSLFFEDPELGVPSGIDITGGKYSSSVLGLATGDIAATGGGGSLEFDGNLALQAVNSATLSANSGDTISIGQSVSIGADDLKFIGATTEANVDAHGGYSAITAQNGGVIAVAGNATVSADASATVNAATNYSGTAQGGSATIEADGGKITIGGSATIQADGFADTANTGFDGSASSGGAAQLIATNSGSVSVGGDLQLNADGTGSPSSLSAGGTGGAGTGGSSTVSADSNGSLAVGGTTTVTADGFGGGVASPDGTAGAGQGGTAILYAGPGGAITFAGDANFNAAGNGGSSPAQGGAGLGGYGFGLVDGGSLTANGSLGLFADGQGGAGLVGGNGSGGFAELALDDAASAAAAGSLEVDGNLTLQAAAQGGGGVDSVTGAGGTGGTASGGGVEFFANSNLQPGTESPVKLGNAMIDADATGGAGGNGITGGDGGGATAGSAATSFAGGSVTANTLQTNASAFGGGGGAGGAGAGGAGGAANGGSAEVAIADTVTANSVSLTARAVAGNGGTGSTSAGDGGNASGAYPTMDVAAGGELDGNATLSATAVGGDGANGGVGQGGDDIVLSVEGTLKASFVNVDSSGTGGNGIGGNGGDSFGGDSELLIDGGAVSVANNLFIGAAANADLNNDGTPDGSGGSVNGGKSSGGDAGIVVGFGGSLEVGGETDLIARGIGGAGGTGTGGSGNGGDAYFYATSTQCSSVCAAGVTASASITNVGIHDLALNANGRGGAGGSSTIGGAGGEGGGGTTYLEINLGSSFGANDILASAQGTGGNGGSGSAELGGDGGVAQGGDSELYVGGTLLAASYNGLAHGTGGNGGDGSTVNGSGGAGRGGYATADVDVGGTVSLTGGSSSLPTFRTSAAGIGGNGASGGSATAGNAYLTVDGSLDSAGLIQVTGQAVGGVGSTGTGGNADASEGSANIDLTGSASAAQLRVGSGAYAGSGATNGGDAIGGSAQIWATGGSLKTTGGGSVVEADAFGGAGSTGNGMAQAGSATVDASDSANLALQDLTISAMGDAATGSVAISAGGTIAAGDLTLTSAADIAMPTVGTNILVSGKLDLETEQNLAFADVTAGSFEFQAAGTVTGGNINVRDHVSGNAGDAIALGDITTGPGLPTNSSDFSVGIASQGSITVGNVDAIGNVGFASAGGLTTGNVTAGALFMALVSGDVNAGSIVTAADGKLYIGDSSMFAAAGGSDNFDLTKVLALDPVVTSGSLTITGPVTTGTIQAAIGKDLSVANVTAGTSVDLAAGGLATFEGSVSSPNITVSSSDIDVAQGASLGVLGVTNLLTLNAVSDQPIVVGGEGAAPATTGQYVLNEQGDIRASSVVLNAVAAGDSPSPNIDIYNLKIDGSGTTGGGVSSVAFNTASSILVQGALDYMDAGSKDSLTLNAGKNVEVITDSGSISMTNSAGAPTGALNLQGTNVWIADQSIMTRLEQDPTTVSADDLAANGGTSKPAGYITASTITANIGSSFLVQNSGSSDDFGGLTVGDGGLVINGAASNTGIAIRPAAVSVAQLDIYGRQVKSDGSTITGGDFVPTVKTAGNFTTGSTINGCPLGGCPPPPPPPPPPSPPPVVTASDQVLGPLQTNDNQSADGQSDDNEKKAKGDQERFNTTFKLIDTTPINLDRQIDEPVTSGNDVNLGLGSTGPH